MKRKFESLREKLRALYRRDSSDIHEKVLRLHASLKRKHADVRDYFLFDLITGSTPEDSYRHFDFPAPDSIEDFIDAEFSRAFPDNDNS